MKQTLLAIICVLLSVGYTSASVQKQAEQCVTDITLSMQGDQLTYSEQEVCKSAKKTSRKVKIKIGKATFTGFVVNPGEAFVPAMQSAYASKRVPKLRPLQPCAADKKIIPEPVVYWDYKNNIWSFTVRQLCVKRNSKLIGLAFRIWDKTGRTEGLYVRFLSREHFLNFLAKLNTSLVPQRTS